MASEPVYFSSFDVSKQVFLRTPHVVGVVNLMPIVPCHVLLIPPSTEVKRLASLPTESVAPFFRAVQVVTSTLERVTGSTSSNVAIQDGPEAGQTVPHLHVHVLPRKRGDFKESDEIYGHLESFGFSLAKLQAQAAKATAEKSSIAPDADEQRKPRSAKEMKAEADWLASIFKDVSFE